VACRGTLLSLGSLSLTSNCASGCAPWRPRNSFDHAQKSESLARGLRAHATAVAHGSESRRQAVAAFLAAKRRQVSTTVVCHSIESHSIAAPTSRRAYDILF